MGAPLSFPTKVDVWLVLLLVCGQVAGIAAVALAARENPRVLVPGGLGLALAAAVVLLLSFPTRYELHDRELVVRSGRLRYRFEYDAITSVRPSRSPLSAPAWSLDRLEIRAGRRTILVSPRERSAFLDALAARAPSLVRKGDALVKPVR